MRISLLVVLAAAVLAGPPRILGAQLPDSCARVFTGGETRIDSLFVSVEPAFRMPKVPTPGLHTFAASVGSLLELPRPFELPGVVDLMFKEPAPEGDSPVTSGRYREGLMGEVMVELDRKAGLKRVLLTQTTLTPAIDAALVKAARAAADVGISDELRGALRKAHGAMLFVRLRTVAGSISRNEESFAAVAVAALPVPVVDVADMPRGRKQRAPSYPIVARDNGVDGKVNLVFVIGRDGRVVPGTVNILGDTKREFAKASIEALMRAEFTPAMVGACPVATLVVQPFTFTIER